MLLGYYSTVVNAINILPVQEQDVPTASILNDAVEYTLRDNNFGTEGDKIKLSGIISGLLISYVDVVDTGETDEFSRPIRKVRLSHVPDYEVVLDPLSRLEDYSDARYIHRFKWMSEDQVDKAFSKYKREKIDSYYNHLGIPEAEFAFQFNHEFTGRYKIHDNYLIVHTVITDGNDRTWSIYWCGEEILDKQEITYKEVRFPYRVEKLHTSNKAEYYGLFREVFETQRAINQALVKIQLMANSQRAFIEEGAVDNMADFTDAFNRVTGVIPMKDLNGVRIENMSSEILNQYAIIDKAFDRIQRVLSINDSFLGMAFASDSGRKVKLQQNATITALRYITNRLEQFYRLLGWDIANLIKQYYTAHQVLRVSDPIMGFKWVEVNKPMMQWSGRMNAQTGQPEMEPVMEQVMNPEDGKPMEDEHGNWIFAPIPEQETEIAFTNVDIEISASAYNDEDEKNQLMLETVLAGPVGQFLSQVNPAGYLKAASLNIRSMKTKYAPVIGDIIDQTSQMLGQNAQAQQEASMMAQGGGGQRQQPMSQSMKLPQNTNESLAE